MPRALTVVALLLLSAACSGGATSEDAADGGDGAGGSSGGTSSGGTSSGGTSSGGGGGTSSGDVGADADVPVRPAGKAVLLYTGAKGGGPATDLYVSDVSAAYAGAGVDATESATIPADFVSRYAVMLLLNPREALPTDAAAAAKDLVSRGGRVVVVMEHCKNGCWGDEADDNALLTSLGSSIRLSGKGGAPLSETHLTVAPTPVSTGISDLVAYYSGSVTGGTPLGTIPGGDTVIAYEAKGAGDVVAIADSSMFGYVLGEGSNKAFVAGLAELR